MSILPKHSTETQLPNIYTSCMFWLPREKYLLYISYSSLGPFYLQRRISDICTTHEFLIFQLKCISTPNL